MKIEKLTDEERECLIQDSGGLAEKALRIIDALTSELEAAEDCWERGHDDVWAERAKAEARAEALQAEVTRLTAALEAVEQAQSTAAQFNRNLVRQRGELESRAEALQARVADLEREVVCSDAGRDSAFDLIEQKNNELDAAHEALEIAESELAQMRGRVERAEDELQATDKWPLFRIRRAWEILRGR